MPKCIFENFEIALVKRGQFKFFFKSWGWFTPKIVQTKHLVSGWAHQTNKDFVSLSFIFVLIYFKSGQLEIPQQAIKKNSIQLQNAVNGAMLIAMNRVIMLIFLYFMGVFIIFLWSLCWTKHLSLITLRNCEIYKIAVLKLNQLKCVWESVPFSLKLHAVDFTKIEFLHWYFSKILFMQSAWYLVEKLFWTISIFRGTSP